MSNPTSVVVITDTLAQFLARTNQFSETNQDLIQEKFNKKTTDGASAPIFAALSSRSRAVAQWPNMVDDFLLAFFTAQAGAELANNLGPVGTTDATPTSIGDAITALPNGAVGWIDVKVFGKFATKDFVYKLIRGRFESDGVTLSIDIDDDPPAEYSAGGTLSTATAALILNGIDVEVQVTGEAATTISWIANVRTFIGFEP